MASPFEIPYSIQCDANGNGSHTEQLGNDYWFAASISGTTTGNPIWTVKRAGVFLRPGLGPSVVLSAGLCAPGTRIDLSVTNAAPNAIVSGMFHGLRATSVQELIAIGGGISDISSTFTSTQSPQTQQTVALPNGGGTVNVSVAVQVGTHALGFVFAPNALQNINSLTVTGATTGTVYFSGDIHFFGSIDTPLLQPFLVMVSPAADPTINVQIVYAGGGPASTAWINEVIDAQAVQLQLGSIFTTKPLSPHITNQLTSIASGSGTASVVFPALLNNNFYTVAYGLAKFLNGSGAAATSSRIQITDGIAGVIFDEWIGLPGTAGLSDSVPIPAGIKGSPGATMTIAFNSACPALAGQSISAGVWQ